MSKKRKVNDMSNPKNTRKCIVCKQHADKSELIRFVKNAEGKVVLDRSQKRTAEAFGCIIARTAYKNLSKENSQRRI